MPRIARIKSENAVYHIMIRSISEVDLFKDDNDKVMYLNIMKKYQKLYHFGVYAYCLMDNHAHFMIDALGSDISKVMHCINFKYAQYFNKRHGRHGHLFQDRFKSKIVNDDRYFLALSAYIHNNATDIQKYKKSPQRYKFSSLSLYLSGKKDPFKLIKKSFIKSILGENIKSVGKNYLTYVLKCNDLKIEEEAEFENEGTSYESGRKIIARNFKPEDIVTFISNRLGIPKSKLFMKYSRKLVEGRALIVILMRSFCNMKCKDICRTLGNITQGRVSRLSNIGIDLISKNKLYNDVVDDFISLCHS